MRRPSHPTSGWCGPGNGRSRRYAARACRAVPMRHRRNSRPGCGWPSTRRKQTVKADAVTDLAGLVELACYTPRPCTPTQATHAHALASTIVTAKPIAPAPRPAPGHHGLTKRAPPGEGPFFLLRLLATLSGPPRADRVGSCGVATGLAQTRRPSSGGGARTSRSPPAPTRRSGRARSRRARWTSPNRRSASR